MEDKLFETNSYPNTENFELSFPSNTDSFDEYKESMHFTVRKGIRILFKIIEWSLILDMSASIIIGFSYTTMLICIITSVILACADDIVAAITYATSRNKVKDVVFHNDSFEICSDSVRTDMKYDVISDIIVTDAGVHLNLKKKANLFLVKDDVEKVIPFFDFVSILESKTDKRAKLDKYTRRKGLVSSIVSVIVAVGLMVLPLEMFRTPNTMELDEFAITLNFSYITDSDDGLSVWATSSYEGLSVCFFNYMPDEFAYDYDCETPKDAEEVIKIYAESYVGNNNGKYITQPQKLADGSYTCEIEYKYIDETYDEYVRIIPQNEKYYFVLFQTVDEEMTDEQKQKISDYIETVEIGEPANDSWDSDYVY